MPIWFNYCPLAPLVEKYTDDGTRVLCSANVSIANVGDFEVSLIGSKTSVELVRIATLNSDGTLSIEQQDAVGRLIDHMVCVLRLTYDQTVDVVRWGETRISIGSHGVAGKPNLGISISEIENERPQINSDNIRNVFVGSMSIRHLMKLLGDTQDHSIPLQYKFLSLYKIFELEFRVKKKWNGLRELLAKYEQEYRELKLSSRSFANLLHELRDKCAHIKTGNNDQLGIIGLDGSDAKSVGAIMPLLKKIVVDHITAKYTHLSFTQPAAGNVVPDIPTS